MSERSCEQIVQVSVPQVTEQFVACFADVPVPRILKEIVRHHRVMLAGWNIFNGLKGHVFFVENEESPCRTG